MSKSQDVRQAIMSELTYNIGDALPEQGRVVAIEVNAEGVFYVVSNREEIFAVDVDSADREDYYEE